MPEILQRQVVLLYITVLFPATKNKPVWARCLAPDFAARGCPQQSALAGESAASTEEHWNTPGLEGGAPYLLPGPCHAAAHILPQISVGWLAACQPDAICRWLLAHHLFCRGDQGSCSGGKLHVVVSWHITVEYCIILEVFPAGFTIQANIRYWEVWQSWLQSLCLPVMRLITYVIYTWCFSWLTEEVGDLLGCRIFSDLEGKVTQSSKKIISYCLAMRNSEVVKQQNSFL